METYGEIIFLLSFAGIFISIISFALCAICKRTKKYAKMTELSANIYIIITYLSFGLLII